MTYLPSGGCSSHSHGTKFLVAFMQSSSSNPVLELYPATKRTTTVRVDVKTPAFLVNNNPVVNTFGSYTNALHQAFSLPVSVIPSGVASVFHGIEVTASLSVGLFGMDSEGSSCDGFMAMPVDMNGLEYYIMSHAQGGLSEFIIVAELDNTVVKIILADAGPQLRFTYSGTTYTSGSTLTIPLNAYRVFQAQSSGDFTGTKIVADKRIAVYSGSVNSAVAPGQVAVPTTGLLVETLFPTTSWGTSHYIVPIPDRSRGDMVKLITKDDVTEVTFRYSAQGN